MTNVKGVKEWHTATNFLMLYGFEIKKDFYSLAKEKMLKEYEVSLFEI